MSALSQAQRSKGDAFHERRRRRHSKNPPGLPPPPSANTRTPPSASPRPPTPTRSAAATTRPAGRTKGPRNCTRTKLKSLGEASKCLSDAGACLKKSHPAEAVGCYRSAVTLLCDAGRLNQAAKLSKQIAEIFENDGAEAEDGGDAVAAAIASYQQAAELFEMEQAKSQASSCLQKVAELSSGALDPPDLLKAAEIYESLGRACLESNLLKYNAKSHFLNAIMCHLANGDAVGASQALARFDGLDYTFADAREGKFASQLVECVDGIDPEGFATACFEYDRISKLDPWKTSIFGAGEAVDRRWREEMGKVARMTTLRGLHELTNKRETLVRRRQV
ncbi:hypothetical protein ACHAXT_011114 [Thalassiosira profunda]